MIETITQMRSITGVSHHLVTDVQKVFSQSYVGRGTLREEILSMNGMSGRKYRLFINNLIKEIGDARYLVLRIIQMIRQKTAGLSWYQQPRHSGEARCRWLTWIPAFAGKTNRRGTGVNLLNESEH